MAMVHFHIFKDPLLSVNMKYEAPKCPCHPRPVDFKGLRTGSMCAHMSLANNMLF